MTSYIFKSDEFTADELCGWLADHCNWARVEFADGVYTRNLSPTDESGWQVVRPDDIRDMLAAIT